MILIVDDDSDTRNSLQRLLAYAGYEAVAVERPLEALSLLGVRAPRAIILDMHLPLMHGLEFLRAIRSDKKFKNTPILVYTSDITHDMETMALAAGANDYIIKGTVGLDSLVQRIDKLAIGQSFPLRIAE